MLTGVHFLLSYTCNLKCDHCFLYCSPASHGTMTLKQISKVLEEAKRIGTVQIIYFEGGEPFLFYPIMVEGIRRAGEMGFKAGIVSNGYWSTWVEDAQVWLNQLLDLGISDLSVNDDALHYGDLAHTPAKFAFAAAERLGISTCLISKTKPKVEQGTEPDGGKGKPEISGGIKTRGRAVEKFAGVYPPGPVRN